MCWQATTTAWAVWELQRMDQQWLQAPGTASWRSGIDSTPHTVLLSPHHSGESCQAPFLHTSLSTCKISNTTGSHCASISQLQGHPLNTPAQRVTSNLNCPVAFNSNCPIFTFWCEVLEACDLSPAQLHYHLSSVTELYLLLFSMTDDCFSWMHSSFGEPLYTLIGYMHTAKC